MDDIITDKLRLSIMYGYTFLHSKEGSFTMATGIELLFGIPASGTFLKVQQQGYWVIALQQELRG